MPDKQTKRAGIAILHLQPDDILVVRFPHLTLSKRDLIEDQLRKITATLSFIPRIIIADAALDISIIRKEAAASPEPRAALEMARRALPMPALFARYCLPSAENVPETCPFCHQPHSLMIARPEPDEIWIFKCHHERCMAFDRIHGKDEVGFMALMDGLDRRQAYHRYLNLAGVQLNPEAGEQ